MVGPLARCAPLRSFVPSSIAMVPQGDRIYALALALEQIHGLNEAKTPIGALQGYH